jgi:hypothetical protein
LAIVEETSNAGSGIGGDRADNPWDLRGFDVFLRSSSFEANTTSFQVTTLSEASDGLGANTSDSGFLLAPVGFRDLHSAGRVWGKAREGNVVWVVQNYTALSANSVGELRPWKGGATDDYAKVILKQISEDVSFESNKNVPSREWKKSRMVDVSVLTSDVVDRTEALRLGTTTCACLLEFDCSFRFGGSTGPGTDGVAGAALGLCWERKLVIWTWFAKLLLRFMSV